MAANCPICGKPAHAKERPFCSSRCRQLDLGKWLTGAYAVPGEELQNTQNLPGDDEDNPDYH